jgi:hypothetical protein
MRACMTIVTFLGFVLPAVLVGVIGGCPGPGPTADGNNPVVNPADFVAQVDNPLFPLTAGTKYVYQNKSPDSTEDIDVTVLSETKTILGVTCTVVHDQVTVGGDLTEDTFDWYAQDRDGAVWYFGEDTKTLDKGVVVSTEGSWEAGVDGALPGIIMEANPQVGDSYRQEFLAGVAEDQAEVVGLAESATVPFGTFDNCLKTRETTPLEAQLVEFKFYTPGVGLVLTLEGGAREELLSVTP